MPLSPQALSSGLAASIAGGRPSEHQLPSLRTLESPADEGEPTEAGAGGPACDVAYAGGANAIGAGSPGTGSAQKRT